MSRDSSDGAGHRLSTDRETIRGWADEHRAIPVRYGGDAADDESARYRVVRESTVSESHERVDWDDFFDHLDEGDHVVIYRGAEADEPFDVTHRDDALARSSLSEAELEERLIEGETVTSEIRETTVVESVIVEEATVESELVDTELVDQEVLDVELVERECMGCRLVDGAGGEGGHRDWFGEERYVGSFGARATTDEGTHVDAATDAASRSGLSEEEAIAIDTSNVPFSAELDVEEVWSVTRGFVERFTIESRVADTDIAETDTVEERDIDVEGLHRSIATSDLLDVELSSEEVLNECEIRTEFAEDDRIRTRFDRDRVVEDEVVDRKQLQADVTGGNVLEMEVTSTQDVASEIARETGTPTEADSGRSETTSAASTGGEPEGIEPDVHPGRVILTDDEIGKTVVDATGEEIGMVAAVEENGEVMRVDAHPGITDRIKAALEWGDSGDEDYPVEIEQVERVTDDRVELKGADDLGGTDRAD